MRIPFTRTHLIAALLMSAVMSAFFSGFFTFHEFGPTPQWRVAWFDGFVLGWPVAACLSLLVGKPIRFLAMRLGGK